MTDLNKYLSQAVAKADITVPQALKLTALTTLLSAVGVSRWLYLVGKNLELQDKQARYLLEVVKRNTDKLDEFDIIALRELGLIQDTTS